MRWHLKPEQSEQWEPGLNIFLGSQNKLEAAQAAEKDPRFQPNVDATQSFPEKLPGITMSLGATWIPTDIYQIHRRNARH